VGRRDLHEAINPDPNARKPIGKVRRWQTRRIGPSAPRATTSLNLHERYGVIRSSRWITGGSEKGEKNALHIDPVPVGREAARRGHARPVSRANRIAAAEIKS